MIKRTGYAILVLSMMAMAGCDNGTVSNKADYQATNSAIINGLYDDTENHRAVVGLMNRGTSDIFCTGTLVTPQYVVTAAHCVADLSDQKILEKNEENPICNWIVKYPVSKLMNGVYNTVVGIGSTSEQASQHTYELEEVIVHSKYTFVQFSQTCDAFYNAESDSNYSNDIAILKLREPISSSIAKPIPVLPPWISQNEKLYYPGMQAKMIGFGITDKGTSGTKMALGRDISGICPIKGSDYDELTAEKACRHDTTIMFDNVCHPNADYCDAWGRINGEMVFRYDYEGTIRFTGGIGRTCQGDSGGPTLVEVGGKEYLAGVTSSGDGACAAIAHSTDAPSYYNGFLSNNIPDLGLQYYEICDNGIDDNGDGKVDDDDPECTTPYSATFTYHNPATNKASGGTDDFEVYLVGSFNAESDGTWRIDDEQYKMTSDGMGTHTITLERPRNSSFEYKYHVKGWVNENGEDEGWKTDNGDGGNSFVTFTLNGLHYGYGSDQPYCGNGIVDTESEFCDNDAFRETMDTCQAWSSDYVYGRVKCKLNCEIDLSECSMTMPEGSIGIGAQSALRSALFSEAPKTDATISSKDVDGFFITGSPVGSNNGGSNDPDDSGQTNPSEQKPSGDETPDGTDNKNDDSGDNCSASPLKTSSSRGGLLALLGLGGLLMIRRKRENS